MCPLGVVTTASLTPSATLKRSQGGHPPDFFYRDASRICGVPVEFINPAYTSKTCSRCGQIGNRSKKKFECLNCKHVEHADANAAFNIALAMVFAHVSKVLDMKAVSEPAESALPLMLGIRKSVFYRDAGS